MKLHPLASLLIKKYIREPSYTPYKLNPDPDFLMDYLGWGVRDVDHHDFTYKYIPEPKPKRKLFYKFVRRLPKCMAKARAYPLKFDVSKSFINYLKNIWLKTPPPAVKPIVNHQRAIKNMNNKEIKLNKIRPDNFNDKELSYLITRDMILHGIAWVEDKLNEETGKVERHHIPHNEGVAILTK